MTAMDLVKRVARAAENNGGHAFLVGGAVRDQVLKLPTKDYDVELYGFSSAQAHKLLKKIGRISTVGKSFGVFLVRHSGHAIEVALPRRDIRIGSGHRGFKIIIDPKLSPAEAARRRDFTINAIMLDPLTNQIIDSYRGRADLRRRILRAVDRRFLGDDPLRLQRAFQFTARFRLRPDPVTSRVLRSMVRRRAELSGERKRVEWLKLINAPQPSAGLRLAAAVKYFPPAITIGQDGLAAVDTLVTLAQRYKLKPAEHAAAFWALVFSSHLEKRGSLISNWLAHEGFAPELIKQVRLIHDSQHTLNMANLSLNKLFVHRLSRAAWPIPLRVITITHAAAINNPAVVAKIKRRAGPWWDKKPAPVITGDFLHYIGWPPAKIYGQVQLAGELAFEHGHDIHLIRRTVINAATPTEALSRLRRLSS